MHNHTKKIMHRHTITPKALALYAPPVAIQYKILTIVFSFLLPIVLLPITHNLLQYSEFIEEISKTLVIFFFIHKIPSITSQAIYTILIGFIFGLSESLLYLGDIVFFGNMHIFWLRIIWTVPMHTITALTIWLCAIPNKKLIIVGLFIAWLLHITYNEMAAQIFF